MDAAATRLLPLVGRVIAWVVAIASAAFLALLLFARSQGQVPWLELLDLARLSLQIVAFAGAFVLLALGVPMVLVAMLRMWGQALPDRKPWWIRLNPNNLIYAPHLLTPAGLVQRRRIILGSALLFVAVLLAVLGIVLEGLETRAT